MLFIPCDVLFLVRLQGKFEIDHSSAHLWCGAYSNDLEYPPIFPRTATSTMGFLSGQFWFSKRPNDWQVKHEKIRSGTCTADVNNLAGNYTFGDTLPDPSTV